MGGVHQTAETWICFFWMDYFFGHSNVMKAITPCGGRIH